METTQEVQQENLTLQLQQAGVQRFRNFQTTHYMVVTLPTLETETTLTNTLVNTTFLKELMQD